MIVPVSRPEAGVLNDSVTLAAEHRESSLDQWTRPMTRIAAIQPDSVPLSFPGTGGNGTSTGSQSASGGLHTPAPAPSGDGDSVTLSAEAIAALALLSAEATDTPSLPSATKNPFSPVVDTLPPDADIVMAADMLAPEMVSVPMDQPTMPFGNDVRAGLDAAALAMAISEDVTDPAIWGRAYERTLRSAPDKAAPGLRTTGPGGDPELSEADRVAFDMTESGGVAENMDKALADRLIDAGLVHDPAARILTGRAGNRLPAAATDLDPVLPDITRDLTDTLDAETAARDIQQGPGVDERVAAMYAPTTNSRVIQNRMSESDEEDDLPEQPNRVTNPLLDTVAAWRGRRLDPLYPVIFHDSLHVKIHEGGILYDRPVHAMLGMRINGAMDLLGFWIERHEDSRFGQHIMDALKHRGIEDVLMAVIKGPDGFSDIVRAAFPQALVHPTIEHLLHHLPDFMALQDHASNARKAVLAALAESPWGRMLVAATNSLKMLNVMLVRAIQARGPFSSDEAALAFLFLTANARGYVHAPEG